MRLSAPALRAILAKPIDQAVEVNTIRLTCYFQFYNGRRRYSSLGRRTPDVVYFGTTGFGTAA